MPFLDRIKALVPTGVSQKISDAALVFLAYSAGLTAILVLLSPAQFGDLPLLLAIGFWATHVFGLLLGAALSNTALGLLGWPLKTMIWTWSGIVLAGVFGALLFSPIALLIDQFLDMQLPDETALYGGLVGEWLDETLGLAPFSVIGWMALNGLLMITRDTATRAADVAANETEKTMVAKQAAASGQPIATETGFRAPERADANRLVSVSAEQHYARFQYTDGNDLILGSMKEIEESLVPLNGIRSHRSAWLNPRHVLQIKPSGSAYEAIMAYGPPIPIARRRVAEVRDAFTQWRGKL